MKLSRTLVGLMVATGLAGLATAAPAAELAKVGISVGSLGNPFFVATIKGITDKAKAINPNVDVISVSSDYDLNKQFTQIDNFIAAGVNVIMVNAVDPKALAPAIKKAQAAGIVVGAFDVAAAGADVTVMTNNVKAGEEACQYLAEKIGNKGNVLIINGPQVSSVIDRVKGCKDVLAKTPDIKVLSDDQDGKGSRDGGYAVAQSLLTRFSDVAGIFAINDPQAIGAGLAAKQVGRNDIIITSVDGAPDVEAELKNSASLVKASASQDPYTMAGQALVLANDMLNGKKPAEPIVLLDPQLITGQNIASYKGWASH